MKTNRIKLAALAIRSRADLETLVGEIAGLKLAEINLTAQMDAAVQAARQQYDGRLAAVRQALIEKTDAARDWAEANPAEFGGLKSLELPEGVVGWRTGPPALRLQAGSTWDQALAKLKSLPTLRGYIRTKEEINKQLLLADRAALAAETWRNIGLRVVQEESFFVEPKLAAAAIRSSVNLAA